MDLIKMYDEPFPRPLPLKTKGRGVNPLAVGGGDKGGLLSAPLGVRGSLREGRSKYKL
jgi:hypothetical protein